MPELNDFCLPENVLPFGNALNDACKKRGLPPLCPEQETKLDFKFPVLHRETSGVPLLRKDNEFLPQIQNMIPLGNRNTLENEGNLFPTKPSRSGLRALYELVTSAPESLYENVSKIPSNFDQVWCMKGIVAKHPSILYNVAHPWFPIPWSSTQKAYKFSNAGGILPQENGDDGSSRGAFRHMIWQSDIASRYGTDVAQEIGNCHERNTPFNLNKRVFSSPQDADSAVDQLNNIIGRDLNNRYKNLNSKERVFKLLEYAYRDGFYIAQRDSQGVYHVVKRKISAENYLRLYDEFLRRDDYGRPIYK